MGKSQKTIIFFIIGLSVVAITVMTALLVSMGDKSQYRINNRAPEARQALKSENSRSGNAVEKTAAQSPAGTAVSESPPAGIETLKQSDKLNMELVDASLRDYFVSLCFKYRHVSGKEEFLTGIRKELNKQFPPETARELLKIFEAFFDCELKLQERLMTYEHPETEADKLFMVNDIHEFRRSQLGEELADKLYGREYKLTKYKIRKQKIYDNDDLYGMEKERQLRLLAAEIFGDKADENIYDKSGESLFREKLLLYEKDFAEMTAEEKQARIQEFRAQYLSPEEIEKIEAAKQKAEIARSRDVDYNDRKKAILNDSGFSDDEKQEKIRTLQEEIYGDRADEIRRGEAFARRHNQKMKSVIPKDGD